MKRLHSHGRLHTFLLMASVCAVTAASVFILPSNQVLGIGETSNEIYYTSPSNGECLKGGPGSSYTIRWTIPVGAVSSMTALRDPRSLVNYAHILYSTEWGNYDRAKYISPQTSAIYLTGDPPSPTLPWNFATVWNEVPDLTASGTVWLRIEADDDKDRNNGYLAWIRPWGTAVPFSIDNSPPKPPSILSSSKTDTTVRLNWTSSPDEGCMGLTGYKIYRNETAVTTVTNGILTYTDTNLQPGTSYNYRIVAYDKFHSSSSTSFTATTTGAPDPQPLPAPAPSFPTNTGGSSESSVTSTTSTGSATPAGGTSASGTTDSPLALASTMPASGSVGTTNNTAASSPSPFPPASIDMTTITELPEKSVKLYSVQVDTQNFAAEEITQKLEVKRGVILRMVGIVNPPGSTIQLAIAGSRRIEKVITADTEGKWLYDLDTSSVEIGDYRISGSIQNTDGSKGTESNLLKLSLFTSLPGGATVLNPQKAPVMSLLAYFLVSALVIIGIIGITFLYLKRKNLLPSSGIEQPEPTPSPSITLTPHIPPENTGAASLPSNPPPPPQIQS